MKTLASILAGAALAHCAKEAGKYKGDLPLLRQRVTLGFDQLLKRKEVIAQKTAAVGFCFGGTTVLELTRSGCPSRVS